MAAYKPDGYTTVSPYLIVERGEDTIAFLVDALDAEELRRFEDEGGRLVHAEVRIGDTIVMIGSVDAERAVPCHVHVYVADVDASYQRALAAGATSVQAPVKRDDPDKRGGVALAGVTWWLATTVG